MSKPLVSVPKTHKEVLLAIGAYAQKLGTRAWLVGGAVRDFYLKKATLDKQGQEELLEQRRAEIKNIQEAKGDIKAIEAEMLKILNIQ